jgi:hypothetical protein
MLDKLCILEALGKLTIPSDWAGLWLVLAAAAAAVVWPHSTCLAAAPSSLLPPPLLLLLLLLQGVGLFQRTAAGEVPLPGPS